MYTSWCEKSRDLKQGLVAQPVLTGSQLAVRPKLLPPDALFCFKSQETEAQRGWDLARVTCKTGGSGTSLTVPKPRRFLHLSGRMCLSWWGG